MPSKKPQKTLPVAPDLIKIAPSMLQIPLSLRKYRANAPNMTPNDFIRKWRANALKERSASQSHFNDLCALLGLADPNTADPTGEWFTFEKGVGKTSGGDGWADVWRKGAFAWEYKGKHANLEKAFAQLLQYQVGLENPPLMIVSDMETIRIHTNFTNTVQEVLDFSLDDLLDAEQRERLKCAFTDPDAFKPSKTRAELTEETAREFASLAQRLRERGHASDDVAHFIQQLIFCMFAEDAKLLPDNMFTDMLQLCRFEWKNFPEHAGTLFGAMAQPGGKVGFKRIEWFNGGLFNGAEPLPLTEDDVEQLAKVARRDWSQIDPAIMGTLFERGLDPAKRSQLGAHYTDREKIMMIVKPVIIDPLQAEWAETLGKMAALIDSAPKRTEDRLLTPADRRKREKLLAEAGAIHNVFIERLVNFRVLDPACGSGNFLYVALRSLKDLEHRANLDAEALGLPRGFPRVGPECVLGIELNSYAAELARVSVWIGEIQWMRRNGFEPSKNPILKPLQTIECRDALMDADGKATKWPRSDVIVGNPPFLGGRDMKKELGTEYVNGLRKIYDVPGAGNFVMFWFRKAGDILASKSIDRFGLVASKEAFAGAGIKLLNNLYVNSEIVFATSNIIWPSAEAAVRVNITVWERHGGDTQRVLDGNNVAAIHPNVKGGETDLTKTKKLAQNLGVAFIGVQPSGPFDVSGELAREWLNRPMNVHGKHNASVLRPYWNTYEIVRRSRDQWVVDFDGISLGDAAYFEDVFEHISKTVGTARLINKSIDPKTQDWLEKFWHLHWRPRPEMRAATKNFSRIILTPFSSKHRVFIFAENSVLASNNLVAIARDDDTFLGNLESSFHRIWSLAKNMDLGKGGDPRYPPTMTFETFPFPAGLTPNIPAADYADDRRAIAIAAAAARLNELRENWLNPQDLIIRTPEVVPGYPDRILPRDAAAAVELKKRTLTNLYNARPAWLDNAHKALDLAVADAYGWGDDWRAGAMTEDEILARLFRLNQERAAAG